MSSCVRICHLQVGCLPAGLFLPHRRSYLFNCLHRGTANDMDNGFGGGLQVFSSCSSGCLIDGNTFRDNTVPRGDGGGFFAAAPADMVLSNNAFDNNAAGAAHLLCRREAADQCLTKGLGLHATSSTFTGQLCSLCIFQAT